MLIRGKSYVAPALSSVFMVFVLPMLVPARSAGAPATWQVGTEPSITTGKYGTDTNTTVFYMPYTVKRLYRDGDVSFVFPIESVTTSNQVTIIGGVPTPNGQPRTSTTTERVTHSGLGDLELRGRYYLIEEQTYIPEVAVTSRIKFPTASRDKGLGTGEFDEGFGTEFAKDLTQNWVALAGAGYTFIGNPPGQNFRDRWDYDLGAGRYIRKTLLISAYYEESRALVAGDSNPQDLFFAVQYALKPVIHLSSSMLFGLSDGAPAFGFSAGANVRF